MTSFIVFQEVLLLLVIACPAWILCKKKAKPAKLAKNSNETLMVKSAIKPPITDATPSQMGPPKDDKKEEEKKEEEKKEKKEEKEEEKKEDGEKKESKEKSMKPFPKFEMPTESKKNQKILANENDKRDKIKKGFYQEKSDNDDTLEKVDSLKVEQSDKTKRSQKNKEKKKE